MSKFTSSFSHSQKQAVISIIKYRCKPDFSVDLPGQIFYFKIYEYNVKTLKVKEILGWLSTDSSYTISSRDGFYMHYGGHLGKIQTVVRMITYILGHC